MLSLICFSIPLYFVSLRLSLTFSTLLLPLSRPPLSPSLHSFCTVLLLSVPNLNSDLFDLQPAFIPAVQSTPSISTANSAWGGMVPTHLHYIHIYEGNRRDTHKDEHHPIYVWAKRLPSGQSSHLSSHSLVLVFSVNHSHTHHHSLLFFKKLMLHDPAGDFCNEVLGAGVVIANTHTVYTLSSSIIKPSEECQLRFKRDLLHVAAVRILSNSVQREDGSGRTVSETYYRLCDGGLNWSHKEFGHTSESELLRYQVVLLFNNTLGAYLQ